MDMVNGFDGHSLTWTPLSPRWVGLKLLENDPQVAQQVSQDPGLADGLEALRAKLANHIQQTMGDDPEGVIADYRYGYIGGVYRQAVDDQRVQRLEMSDKVDRVVTNRFLGPLILLGIIYGVYNFVFWASETPVGWLENLFGWLGGQAEALIPEGLVQSLVVSGVIDGVGGVLGFAPLIMFMFFAIALLEDSGYLARVAYLLDRVLRGFGLHGNSIMAMIVSGGISGGCAVPGVMATRTLRDPKARLATILTVPLMNCGAKLPVYALLIAAFFAAKEAQMMFILTLISWGLALVAARLLRWTVLKGEGAPFVMELPPYRLPTWRGLLIHTWERTWQYIKKAGTVILGISILMWALMTFPSLPEGQTAQWEAKIAAAQSQEAKEDLQRLQAGAELAHSLAGRMGTALSPLTAPLGFDWRTNVALVGGFAAKEVVVATLGTAYSLGEVDPEEAGKPGRSAGQGAGLEPPHGLWPHDLRDGLCPLLCHRGGDPARVGELEVGLVRSGLHHYRRLPSGPFGLSGRPLAGTWLGGKNMEQLLIVAAVVAAAGWYLGRHFWRMAKNRGGSCGCGGGSSCAGCGARPWAREGPVWRTAVAQGRREMKSPSHRPKRTPSGAVTGGEDHCPGHWVRVRPGDRAAEWDVIQVNTIKL